MVVLTITLRCDACGRESPPVQFSGIMPEAVPISSSVAMAIATRRQDLREISDWTHRGHRDVCGLCHGTIAGRDALFERIKP